MYFDDHLRKQALDVVAATEAVRLDQIDTVSHRGFQRRSGGVENDPCLQLSANANEATVEVPTSVSRAAHSAYNGRV